MVVIIYKQGLKVQQYNNMADPIGALNNILKGNRNLPNGGGSYAVANSTPSGIDSTPVDVSLPSQYGQLATPPTPVAPPATTTPDYSSQPGQSAYTPSPVTPTPAAQPQAQQDSGSVDYLDKYRQLALELSLIHISEPTRPY